MTFDHDPFINTRKRMYSSTTGERVWTYRDLLVHGKLSGKLTRKDAFVLNLFFRDMHTNPRKALANIRRYWRGLDETD